MANVGNKSLSFSKFQLYVESQEEIAKTREAKLSDFKNLPKTWSYVYNNTVYECVSEVKEKYLFLSINYGNSEPRGENLYDFEKEETIANPRTSSQAELRNQLFVYYDFKTELLYLNNSLKKTVVKKILKQKTDLIFNVKDIFVDIDDFMQELNTVNWFEFTSIKDIFSSSGEEAERKALEDLTGTTAPTKFSVKAEYKGKDRYLITKFIKKMGRKFESHQLRGLIIKGKSEEGFERIYNTDTFIQKEVLKNVTVDENNQFNPQIVLSTLQHQINVGK